jgi:SAM-dependent methyltransferase
VHDQLVTLLEPRSGEPWLDVATGTGGVAIRAAAAGADVTGVDIAPGMLEGARAKAPQIDFELGDVQELRFDDESFDVVSSCFGFIFAADHAATARELARVCRDRLGFTAWEPSPELRDLYDRFDLDQPEGRHPFQWGRPEHIDELLGEAFDLELKHDCWVLEGADGAELWEFWSRSAPPFKAMAESLEPEKRDLFRAAYIEYCERYREGDRVRVPRPYVLALGRKR